MSIENKIWNYIIMYPDVYIKVISKNTRLVTELKKYKGKTLAQKIYNIHGIQLIKKKYRKKLLDFLALSKSQLRQDLFVISETDFKKNGFFVEIGAADGKICSNTFLLEKHFHWQGILVEPAKIFHKRLHKNRDSSIDKSIIWNKNIENLNFTECHTASTISKKRGASLIPPNHNTKCYDLRSITPMQLLKKYNAPRYIDYLSIDTEGSEFEILSSIDFKKYKFGIITVEHNFRPDRKKIYELLSGNGYKIRLGAPRSFEDWYLYETNSDKELKCGIQ